MAGRRNRAVSLAVGVLTSLSLLVVLTWVALWFWPLRPASLVLSGASYYDNLSIPHNAYGMNALYRLASLAKASARSEWGGSRGRTGLDLVAPPGDLTAGDQWDEQLDRASGRTVLMFLALHGGADDRGAYLLLDVPSGRDRSEKRLYVKDVIDRLARRGSQRFVLVLDATQAPARSDAGVFHNDFARAVRGLQPEIEAASNVVILMSSDVDERSWVFEERRQTAFAHFVIEGLRGSPGVTDNGRLSAYDLWRYVHDRVLRWSLNQRGTIQTPVLLPDAQRARTFELALLPRYQQPAQPEPEMLDAGEMASVWAEAEALQKQQPGPESYTPHLWRQYRDTLIRLDSLAQTLEPSTLREAALSQVGDRLRDLRKEIEAGRRLRTGKDRPTPESFRNSLAMSAIEGPPPTDTLDVEEFSRIWEDETLMPEEVRKKVKQLGLSEFYALLINHVEADPLGRRERVLRLLEIVDEPAASRPIEAQVLAMILRDGPPQPVDPGGYRAVVQTALKTRRRAERVAVAYRDDVSAFSERVAPWISEALERGDALRRAADDLVFADSTESWAEAESLYTRADEEYQKAEARAGSVRTGLSVRDRALADLPYYSEWAANRSPFEPIPAGQPTREEVVDRIEGFWGKAHDLSSVLIREDCRTATDAEVGELEEEARALGLGLDDLWKWYLASLRTLADSDVPEVSGSAIAVLSTPFPLEARRSNSLFGHLVGSSRSLAPTGVEPIQEDQMKLARLRLEEQALEAARYRRRLALAAIGRRWYDELSRVEIEAEGSRGLGGGGATPGASVPTGPADLEKAASLLEPVSYRDVTSRVDIGKDWRGAMVAAGERLRRCRDVMPLTIHRRVEKAEPGSLSGSLSSADELGRMLLGGQSVPEEPSTVYRRRLAQALLISQARRTLRDHWQGDSEPTYYRRAGESYLDDAEALNPSEEDPRGEAAKLREALKQDDRLAVKGPAPIDATSERRLRLEYRLEPPVGGNLPEGQPVAWLTTEPPDLAELVEPAMDQRQILRVEGSGVRTSREDGGGDVAPSSSRMAVTVRFPTILKAEDDPAEARRPEVQEARLILNVRYRGQKIRQETPVHLHPVPDMVAAEYPKPLGAKLAVRSSADLIAAHGQGEGSLAIILDCSGSMNGASGRTADGAPRTKYQEATRALRELLPNVPRNTLVSLWTFGQQVQPGNDRTPAEDTIVRWVAPTPWKPEDGAQLEQVMGQVERLQPYNRSPIVRAMIRASVDFRSNDGFKTLLVLTDGADNRFSEDTEFSASKKTIETVLRDAFSGSDIEINVVGYQTVSAEQAVLKQQFQVIEDLPRPGRFYLVKHSRELAATLMRALRPNLECSVQTMGNEPSAVLDVSRQGSAERWADPGLVPGAYKLVVESRDRYERDLLLNRGDLLLVNLVPGPGGRLLMRRGLFTDEWLGRLKVDRQRDWRASVVRNARVGADQDGLELWTTLEKQVSNQETELEMIRPRQVWMEVSSPSGDRIAQRWGRQEGLPTACWNLRVPAWPSDNQTGQPAQPSVKLWWNPDQEPPSLTSIVRLADFRFRGEIPARPVEVENLRVWIEDVAVETHRIEYRPGAFRDSSCLVVRLRHPEGHPVWARPVGLEHDGEEHRFYSAANRYTGIFWEVTRDRADVALKELAIVSLKRFKDTAKQRGYTAELTRLGTPDPLDVGPDLIPIEDSGPAPLHDLNLYVSPR